MHKHGDQVATAGWHANYKIVILGDPDVNLVALTGLSARLPL